ncbi:phage tail protein [Halomonas sp. RA08-2]|uniref:phage tail protein n=1 Tax=Halomonas sp. RA08-2 TaxID=3440842 RepID=UPI003EEFE333
MAQFYTLLTQVGQAKLANAVALGNTIELTHLAVGDGGGSVPTPDSDRTSLINEVRRAPINRVEVDADNPNWVVVEQVMPPDVGGWTIREIGVFDSAGDLIAYGNYPETYKPTLDEGSGRTQTVRMVLQVSDTAAVTLKVDPSVVLATRQYVDQQREDHEQDPEAHSADQITIVTPPLQAPGAETAQQALEAIGAFAADGLQNVAVFDTPEIHQWNVPEVLIQGLRKAHVTVIGAGGGGARRDQDAGGGGGGGARVRQIEA